MLSVTNRPAAVYEPPARGTPNGELSLREQEIRGAFTKFVGATLFGQMLAAMRKTQDPPAYMHGGRAEEIFQQQFDQHLADRMTEASADQLANPMFELMLARMRNPS